MKRCPQCAENVKNDAKVCRFCGYQFPKSPDPTPGEAVAGIGCAVVILLVLWIVLSKACSSDETATAPPPRQPDAFDIQAGAEQQLRQGLRDPDSARFRGRFVSRLSGGGMALCGEVNAKNSFGGYTGYRRFIAGPTPAQPSFIEGEPTGMGNEVDRTLFPSLWQEFCSNSIQALD